MAPASLGGKGRMKGLARTLSRGHIGQFFCAFSWFFFFVLSLRRLLSVTDLRQHGDKLHHNAVANLTQHLFSEQLQPVA